MAIIGPISFLLPEDVARNLAQQAQARRLADNLSRKTLATLSGVPASTIRQFEQTGKISLLGLLRIADALGCLDNFSTGFPQKTPTTIEDLVAPRRKRGAK